MALSIRAGADTWIIGILISLVRGLKLSEVEPSIRNIINKKNSR
jgi:hypothetical protein